VSLLLLFFLNVKHQLAALIDIFEELLAGNALVIFNELLAVLGLREGFNDHIFDLVDAGKVSEDEKLGVTGQRQFHAAGTFFFRFCNPWVLDEPEIQRVSCLISLCLGDIGL